jgi:hypothetical protein
LGWLFGARAADRARAPIETPSEEVATDIQWKPPPLEMVESAGLARGRIPSIEELVLLNGEGQILWVDSLPKGAELSHEEVVSLMSVMRSPQLLPVVRNNIANRLVERRPVDPYLATVFVQMYENGQEDEVWRDYCIQFLSVLVEGLGRDDGSEALSDLREIGRKDISTVGATALLQEARLVRNGVVPEAEDFSDLLSQRLADVETTGVVRHTLLALIGEDSRVEHLQLVREALESTGSDDATRGALYAIGRIGDHSDVPMVEALLDYPNGAVVMAAKAALDNLSARNGDGIRQ